MTETVSSTAGAAGPSLSGITSGLQFALTNLYSTIANKFNQFFPPEKRNAWQEWLTKFATEKPHLAAFLLSNIALSGPPLALFFIMTLTVVIFSLIAGLLVGLLGAVLFIVFAVGVALVFILPVLFFTTAAAVFVWLWGIGTYYIVKWFNEKEVPGIHTGFAEGVAKKSGMSDLPGMNGDSIMSNPGDANEKPPEKSKRPEATEGQSQGKTTGAQHHGDGKENSSTSQPRKTPNKTAASKDSVGGGAGAATAQTDGAKEKVPV